ncbi:MAG: hypothetical protein ACE5GK_02720 [Nitrospiria bacterium]
MLSRKGKLIFAMAVFICTVGTIGALYIGFVFFRDRQLVFWLFSIYIVGVAGIVVFMVHRYIKTYIT